MAIFSLFSKREKERRGEVPDVYRYDNLPTPLRVQLVHAIRDGFGRPVRASPYQVIVEALCREYGTFRLTKEEYFDGVDYQNELAKFIVTEANVERVLDAVELSCRWIDTQTRDYSYAGNQHADRFATDVLQEINHRFLEHAIGYQFESGQIIRVEDQLLHQEVVKPTLAVLNQQQFAGAQDEFLRAHEHYRHGRTKESMNEALKALESTLKVIAKARAWQVSEQATAKVLLDAAFKNGLVSDFWQSHFSGLRATLEAGVPTARNRQSGHGQGEEPVQVPRHVAAYILHSTAAAILFLAQCHEERP